MTETKLITPKKLKGFWELMPKEQLLFSSILDKIEEVFKKNCFLPLDTPVLEYSEVLLAKSGGSVDKEIYRFTKGDTDMCMRYDLTVPLARFVSMHKDELDFPFKRFQIGKVYRGERPQKGRFREFYQCDADIIGDGDLSIVADAECISLFEKCFKALKLEIEIHVSNRKFLAGFIDFIQMKDKTSEILIILDKLDKISEEDAIQELMELGIGYNECATLIRFTKTKGSFKEVFKALKLYCGNETSNAGLYELQELEKYLDDFGCENVIVDMGVIRGHNYYTGTVFEGFLKGNEGGAVGGGGRYENLCGYFSEKNMPGVGMSVGVTRLFDILMQNGHFEKEKTNEIDIAVINFDNTLDDSLRIVNDFRERGIKAECFYENKSFKSKMKEANRRQVKYILVVGEDEVKTRRFNLKNMETGEQTAMDLQEVVETISNSHEN